MGQIATLIILGLVLTAIGYDGLGRAIDGQAAWHYVLLPVGLLMSFVGILLSNRYHRQGSRVVVEITPGVVVAADARFGSLMCARCEKLNPVGATYCAHCGNKLVR